LTALLDNMTVAPTAPSAGRCWQAYAAGKHIPSTRRSAPGCHRSFDSLYFTTRQTFVDVMLDEERHDELEALGLPLQRPARRSRGSTSRGSCYFRDMREGGGVNVVFYDEALPPSQAVRPKVKGVKG
jgi:hypothetical protein